MIENIESLGTKLQLSGFTEAQVLQHREVDPERRWAIDEAAAGVSDYVPNAGVRCGISLEALGVEPLLLRVRSVFVGIAKQIWTTAGDERGNETEPRRIETRRRRSKRQPGVVNNDPGRFPTAEHVLDEAVVVLQEERQLVVVVRSEDVTTVERRATPVQTDVERTLRRCRAIGLVVCQVLGPRVREAGLGFACEATGGKDLQAVIAGIETRLDDIK